MLYETVYKKMTRSCLILKTKDYTNEVFYFDFKTHS